MSISTPIMIHLDGLPYASLVSGGNYVLLRIEENLVGICVGSVLSLIIFSAFAMNVLKTDIQSERASNEFGAMDRVSL